MDTTPISEVMAKIHNRSLFSAKQLITSDTDLKAYLRKMPNKCIKLVGDGKYILHYNDITSLSSTEILNKKVAIILNTKHSSNTSDTPGHWLVLLISKQKKCLFIDSLNKGGSFKDDDIVKTVKMFCMRHNLHFIDWKTRTQGRLSQACGFTILYYIDLFAKHGLPAFEKLKKMFLNYSIRKREYFILQKAFRLI